MKIICVGERGSATLAKGNVIRNDYLCYLSLVIIYIRRHIVPFDLNPSQQSGHALKINTRMQVLNLNHFIS